MKQQTKSFSFKKNDSPLIKKFVEEQSNFSESVRYLIIKYCKENGVEDVSNKLLELVYGIETEPNVKKYSEHSEDENVSVKEDKTVNKVNQVERTKNKKVIKTDIDIYSEYE